MKRITIKHDPDGNVMVIGDHDPDDAFYAFALGKVLAGKYTEISWEPILNPYRRATNDKP